MGGPQRELSKNVWVERSGYLQVGRMWVHCATLGGRLLAPGKTRKSKKMYAIIRTGGKQYRVSEGDTLRVEKLDGDVGASIEFGDVLMVGGDKVSIGKPLVSGAKVAAEITAQDRSKRVIVFKMKRRKNYRRKRGHRQPYTELKITGISV